MTLPDPQTLDALIAEARAASLRAHCPYSNFRVGAAVLTDADAIISGCNVENASYGLALCAERNAVVAAVLQGMRAVKAVAIFTPTGSPVTPCGACRQVLREFTRDAPVVSVCLDGQRLVRSLVELLPDSFGPESLT
jgi:cytidine deaminase